MNADTLPLHLHYTQKDNCTLTASTHTVYQKDKVFVLASKCNTKELVVFLEG